MTAKTLNVGMVGYKFMGKAHSNAYRQVGRFFPDLEVKPVMKALCGRDEAGGHVGALLTVMLERCLGLRKYSLTPEELAAETTMTAARVRELLGNAMATQDELQQISKGIGTAHFAF